MAKIQPGARVGAIKKADASTVWLYGYGTYDGDHVPPDGAGFFPGMPNPRITLDDGSVVWGFQCWWGPEDKIKDEYKNHTVVQVSVKDA